MQNLMLMIFVMVETFYTYFLHMIHHDYEININHEDLGDNKSHGWLLDTNCLLKKLFWYDNSSWEEYVDAKKSLKAWLLMYLWYNCWMTLENTAMVLLGTSGDVSVLIIMFYSLMFLMKKPWWLDGESVQDEQAKGELWSYEKDALLAF